MKIEEGSIIRLKREEATNVAKGLAKHGIPMLFNVDKEYTAYETEVDDMGFEWVLTLEVNYKEGNKHFRVFLKSAAFEVVREPDPIKLEDLI